MFLSVADCVTGRQHRALQLLPCMSCPGIHLCMFIDQLMELNLCTGVGIIYSVVRSILALVAHFRLEESALSPLLSHSLLIPCQLF